MDLTSSDVFMMVITPVEAYTDKFTWITPLSGDKQLLHNYATIIAPTGRPYSYQSVCLDL